jgi:hypothetical protein
VGDPAQLAEFLLPEMRHRKEEEEDKGASGADALGHRFPRLQLD